MNTSEQDNFISALTTFDESLKSTNIKNGICFSLCCLMAQTIRTDYNAIANYTVWKKSILNDINAILALHKSVRDYYIMLGSQPDRIMKTVSILLEASDGIIGNKELLKSWGFESNINEYQLGNKEDKNTLIQTGNSGGNMCIIGFHKHAVTVFGPIDKTAYIYDPNTGVHKLPNTYNISKPIELSIMKIALESDTKVDEGEKATIMWVGFDKKINDTVPFYNTNKIYQDHYNKCLTEKIKKEITDLGLITESSSWLEMLENYKE
jgi:hypothetical protein